MCEVSIVLHVTSRTRPVNLRSSAEREAADHQSRLHRVYPRLSTLTENATFENTSENMEKITVAALQTNNRVTNKISTKNNNF